MGEQDRRHVHFGEMGLRNGQWVTSGLYGWTLVVTGTGKTIAHAQANVYERVKRISIPNGRYRLDIGDKLMGGEFDRLERLGILDR
jgi:phosphoribosylamine--glycine ligase